MRRNRRRLLGAKDGRPAARNLRALLLNEQVFLGWVRAAVALLGLGFALDRFQLQMGRGTLALKAGGGHHLSGLLLMATGLAVLMWALIRYWRVRTAILRGRAGPRHPAESRLPQVAGVIMSLVGLRLLWHLLPPTLHSALVWRTWQRLLRT